MPKLTKAKSPVWRKIGLFFGKVALLLLIPGLCLALAVLLYLFIARGKWQKLPLLPAGATADILDVDIDPHGHIDQLYAMNDRQELFLWQYDPVYTEKTGRNGSWTLVATAKDALITEIVSDGSFPVGGVYGKDSQGRVYVYDVPANHWNSVDLTQLPARKPSSCGLWPKLPVSEQRVMEKFQLCFQGALSEEWRYYLRDNDGSIWLWSKTDSALVFIYLIIGLSLGVILDVCLMIFWGRKILIKIFSYFKSIYQKFAQ